MALQSTSIYLSKFFFAVVGTSVLLGFPEHHVLISSSIPLEKGELNAPPKNILVGNSWSKPPLNNLSVLAS